jgi:hypothetical protein
MIESVKTRFDIKKKGLMLTKLKSTKTIFNVMFFMSANSSLDSDKEPFAEIPQS